MLHITENNGSCAIAREGEELLACAVSFDPAQALELLLALNGLKAIDGTPIYSAYRVDTIPVWSLLQEHLFWEYLQPLVKYRPVIEFLAKHANEPVETSIHGVQVWAALLKSASPHSLKERGGEWRQLAETLFLLVNAWLCGLWGRFRGAKMILWSLNCVWSGKWLDYRLKDVYAELWGSKAPFIEGFPFSGFKPALRRFLGTKRIVFYAPNILMIRQEARKNARHIEYAFAKSFPVAETLMIPLIRHFETMAANVGLHTKLLSRLLRFAPFPRIIGIDEHTSYAALLCAARQRGVELVGLQHGVFHKYSIGWCTPGIPHEFTGGYDLLIVWGEYWRSLLAELSSTYTASRLQVGGFIRPSTIAFKPRRCQPPRDQLRILLPYEFLANPGEIAAFIDAFHGLGYKVLFKVRFDDTLDEQLKMLPREKLELVPELTQELLDSVHVCAGTSTTMMYELLYLGIPSWFIRTKHDSNIHMVEKNLAAEITLSMLAESNFDPWSHILPKPAIDQLFEGSGIPLKLVELIRNNRIS